VKTPSARPPIYADRGIHLYDGRIVEESVGAA